MGTLHAAWIYRSKSIPFSILTLRRWITIQFHLIFRWLFGVGIFICLQINNLAAQCYILLFSVAFTFFAAIITAWAIAGIAVLFAFATCAFLIVLNYCIINTQLAPFTFFAAFIFAFIFATDAFLFTLRRAIAFHYGRSLNATTYTRAAILWAQALAANAYTFLIFFVATTNTTFLLATTTFLITYFLLTLAYLATTLAAQAAFTTLTLIFYTTFATFFIFTIFAILFKELSISFYCVFLLFNRILFLFFNFFGWWYIRGAGRWWFTWFDWFTWIRLFRCFRFCLNVSNFIPPFYFFFFFFGRLLITWTIRAVLYCFRFRFSYFFYKFMINFFHTFIHKATYTTLYTIDCIL